MLKISAIILRALQAGRSSARGTVTNQLLGVTKVPKRWLSLHPSELRKMDRQKYTIFIGPLLFCGLMYVCYIREYEDKESVADYLKSDKLKEDAKKLYGIRRDR